MLCIFTFMQKCKEIIHVHQKCGNHHILANSEMTPYFFIFANRNKTEPREVTKQVVWIILRNRIFHGTIRHIRSGFPSYARTLCALTLVAYALNMDICKDSCDRRHGQWSTFMASLVGLQTRGLYQRQSMQSNFYGSNIDNQDVL